MSKQPSSSRRSEFDLFKLTTDTSEEPEAPTTGRNYLAIIGWVLLIQVGVVLVILSMYGPWGTPSLGAALDVPQQGSNPPAPDEEFFTIRADGDIEVMEQTGSAQKIYNADLNGVRIRGLEVTQGIQVFNEPEDIRCDPDTSSPDNVFCNNSMPLVAGRHTMLRLYLTCIEDCPHIETVVRLYVYKDGVKREVKTAILPADIWPQFRTQYLEEVRLDLSKSVNFVFLPPPEWMQGPITFEADVTINGQRVSNVSLTRSFAVRRPLRVAYLPIEYKGVTPPEPEQIDHWLLRMYPVPSVEYYRLPMDTLKWEGDIDKGEVLRKLLYVYWLHAQHHPTEAWPDQLFGWFPKEFYNGGASDPYWCPSCAGPSSSRVAFGGMRPEQDIGGPRILVHEIAHNLGAQHAWSPTQTQDSRCFKAEGLDIQVDPEWPYAETPYIQEFGIDLYSNPPVVYTPSYYDMMSYCTHPWISPHTYRKIFDSPMLQENPTLPEGYADFRPQSDGGTTVLISGRVYPDGTASRPEIVQLKTDSFVTPPLEFTPPAGDDYCLVVDGYEENIAEYCFAAGFLDSETGVPTDVSTYFFTLPNVDTTEIARITLTSDNAELMVVTPSSTAPQVDSLAVQAESQTVSWQGLDADGDALTYDLLYSSDDGENWLPLSVQGREHSYTLDSGLIPPGETVRFRVIASDGFHTTVADSEAALTVR